MEKRGIRNQVFVATKVRPFLACCIQILTKLCFQYSTNYKMGEGPEFGPKVMYNGNNIKSMHIAVEDSLRKLRTNYIDLLYLHWWDYETGIEEVMNGMHNLVAQGKVLYLVCSHICILHT